ncbi:MAG: HD domain-containing protein [Deltaproteobacteria bacterium]|nr:MAG: HD domain-containing protein [Deltaproteobacteria bacterium]
MEVRDPIVGAIQVEEGERAIVDHPYVQRLRGVRATGFSSMAFPSATHTRYGHSLGVMHLAGKAFDTAFDSWSFRGPGARARFRAAVRLAALCHDLGHSPFSHCTEFAMPPLSDLGCRWLAQTTSRKATHEDYTIAVLENTSLNERIHQVSPCGARHVAALISPEVDPGDDFFVDGDLDYRRVLSQIVSSELDVDRLDYLVRDSYFSGAKYGQIDVPWLIAHLRAVPVGGLVHLGLDARALYAFDDFLIARHHMFLMVYFHHKSVIYEELLRRWVADPQTEWALSADLERYLWQDDLDLLSALRASDSPWARRIVERRPYRRLLEVHGDPSQVDLSGEAAALTEAGIDPIVAGATGRLSRYEAYGQKRKRAPSIMVVDTLAGKVRRQPELPGMPAPEPVRPLNRATRVFERYAEAQRVARIFVPPQDIPRARKVLGLSA